MRSTIVAALLSSFLLAGSLLGAEKPLVLLDDETLTVGCGDCSECYCFAANRKPQLAPQLSTRVDDHRRGRRGWAGTRGRC